ncbi:MAG TPA: SBBP repeat-containing protein [Candidatus Deferrimicrobium sp.]|nr:SBBP repeat-containing protein [Candidatus Deferrimicrobium sp.]
MRIQVTASIAVALVVAAVSLNSAVTENASPGISDITSLTSTPLAFTENQGQWPDSILFRANAGGATTWFTPTGAYYQFTRRIPVRQDPRGPDILRDPDVTLSGVEGRPLEPDSIEIIMIKARFVGCNPSPQVRGQDEIEYKCNFFLGNDPSKWRTDVANYRAISLEEVYPGIDLVYYGDGRRMEYDFRVSAGADYSQIQIQYDGAKAVSVNDAGDLVIETEFGSITERHPIVYQMEAGTRRELQGEYLLQTDNRFTFKLEQSYQPELAIVIDPVLVYSTYLGGGDHEWGTGIAVDDSGAVYVTGLTYSSDFPMHSPFQGTFQGAISDAFVAKLSSAGGSLIYSTYLGGSGVDGGYGIAIDETGSAYVTGGTSSTNFPTLNQYQTDQAGPDVFVTKLSSAGDALVYSTYIGGNSGDDGYDIEVDDTGAAYVVGMTGSTNFPTVNPYQTNPDGFEYDVFVTKLSSEGNSLTYSTYLGGNSWEFGLGLAVDASGSAYVTGYTNSTNFPTLSPYQTNEAGEDVFVTKVSADGGSLVYSTYLGGSNDESLPWERGHDIAVDALGCAYVTGYTSSSNFPTFNPYQTNQMYGDAFVTKLSIDGNSLVYSTYLGGDSDDWGYAIAVNEARAVYVTGFTSSNDFPTLNPFQIYNQGEKDVFVTKLSCGGNNLVYSTYVGGSGYDSALAIAVDTAGAAYVTGQTSSIDFPMLNQYQTSQGGQDAFVIKLVDSCGDLTFRPNPNGWQFGNTSGNMWPQSEWVDYYAPEYPRGWRIKCDSSDFPSWPLFVSAFGEAQSYRHPPPDSIVYNAMAVRKWFALKHQWRGSCYGFAISAFLFFDNYLDSADLPGFPPLYSVPLSHDSRWMVNKYFVYQYGKDVLDNDKLNLATTPTQTLMACQGMFTDSVLDDMALTMYNNHGRGAHTLNPYRCERDTLNSDIWYVYVYDNEVPYDPGDTIKSDTMRVAIDICANEGKGSWTYNGIPGWGGDSLLYLELPSSSFTSTPILTSSSPIRERWTSDRDKDANAASAYVEFYVGLADTVVLESSTGDIGHFGDSLFSSLTDGIPVTPKDRQETRPIGYYLPNDSWSCQLSGLLDSVFHMIVFTDSTIMSYWRWGVDSAEHERLLYGGDDRTVWVHNDDVSPRIHSYELIMAAVDSDVVCEVKDIALSSGDSLRYARTEDSKFQIDNYGEATSYDLRIEIASNDGDGVFFAIGIALDSIASHQVIPDWRPYNDSVMILVDSGMTGVFSETLLVENKGEVLYICGDIDAISGPAGPVDVADLTYLVAYLFQGGAAPPVLAAANVDGIIGPAGPVDVADLTYLVAYLFLAGAAPVC